MVSIERSRCFLERAHPNVVILGADDAPDLIPAGVHPPCQLCLGDLLLSHLLLDLPGNDPQERSFGGLFEHAIFFEQ